MRVALTWRYVFNTLSELLQVSETTEAVNPMNACRARNASTLAGLSRCVSRKLYVENHG